MRNDTLLSVRTPAPTDVVADGCDTAGVTGTLAVGVIEIGCDVLAGAGGREVGTSMEAAGVSCGAGVGSGVGVSTDGFSSETFAAPSKIIKVNTNPQHNNLTQMEALVPTLWLE